MYMLFSSNIVVMELVSSIHFNLSNISSKKIVYLQLSSKVFIDVQFLSNLFMHFVTSIHVHVENIFHVIPMWHRDILKILCLYHQNIPNIFILAHRLMPVGSCARFVMLL
jgi:hypothetical protein